MCKRNSPHKNEASKVCVRETPQIKKEKKKDVRTGRVRETPHIKKRTHHGMCKEIPDNYREMSNELFLKRCVGSGSLALFLSVSRDLVVFVLFCRVFFSFFLRLSLMQILALVLSFYHFEGSFHF